MILFSWWNFASAAPAALNTIHSIGIVLDQEASPVEQRVAGLLKNRILNNTPINFEVGTARKPSADLYIHMGVVRASGALHDVCARESVRPP